MHVALITILRQVLNDKKELVLFVLTFLAIIHVVKTLLVHRTTTSIPPYVAGQKVQANYIQEKLAK
jgi:hypothetical protein